MRFGKGVFDTGNGVASGTFCRGVKHHFRLVYVRADNRLSLSRHNRGDGGDHL